MLYISLTILFLYLFLFIISRAYERDFIKSLDKKEHPLKLIYPTALFLFDRFNLKYVLRRNVLATRESLKELYLLESYPIVEKLYICKKIVLTIAVFFLFNLFILVTSINSILNQSIINGAYINRPSIMEPNKLVDLKVYIQKEEEIKEENIELLIEGREYTREEFYQIIEGELNNIDSYILGENESLDYVTKDLNLITNLPNTPIAIQWSTDKLYLLKENGSVLNEELLNNEIVEVLGKIIYKDHVLEYIRYVNIYPKVYEVEEKDRLDLIKAVEASIDATRTQERIKLPSNLKEYQLTWMENRNSSSSLLFILGLLSSCLVYMAMDKELAKRVDKRNKELLLDYPEMVHKFTLYVGAGMSLSSAWTKIVSEYTNSGQEKRYLYEEMLITYKELSLGVSEIVAYESFGRRIKLLPFLRFSSLITQNTTIGTTTLLQKLELEVADAFLERKELAKRLGEEAGTKLLLPMMIMLLLVLLIIIVPAFTSISL